MDKLNKRLAALEQQRPDGVLTVEQMSDAQLIRILTDGQATDITDEELERILKGEPYATK